METIELNPELERGLQQSFLLLHRKKYDEASEMLEALNATYPNNADIIALREKVANAEREWRVEINRAHWGGLFRIPPQAMLITGLALFLIGGMGLIHAIPVFQRDGWNGVVESRGKSGFVSRYAMKDWLWYNGLAGAFGMVAIGAAACAGVSWRDFEYAPYRSR
ncbi:MAG: hypothetical protein WCP07_01000 [bacterium]